jgi:hypothetical protein
MIDDEQRAQSVKERPCGREPCSHIVFRSGFLSENLHGADPIQTDPDHNRTSAVIGPRLNIGTDLVESITRERVDWDVSIR